MRNDYLKYENEKELQEAIIKFEKAAEKDNIDSIKSFARFYEVRDIDKAIYWYEKAAEAGDEDALYKFGTLCEIQRDTERAQKAIDSLEKYIKITDERIQKGKWENGALESDWVKSSNVDAKRAIGCLYLKPSVRDLKKAVEWLEKSAIQGAVKGAYVLGYIYETEHEIKDIDKAIYWYEKASADQFLSLRTKRAIEKLNKQKEEIVKAVAKLALYNDKVVAIRNEYFGGVPQIDDAKATLALEECAQALCSIINEVPRDKAMKQMDMLRNALGNDVWRKLSPESQKYLITSAVLLKECEGVSSDFDCSMVCIPAIVALETELKKVFFDKYEDFVRENYLPNAFPEIFAKKGYSFSMGKMGEIFGYDFKSQKISYPHTMKDYIRYITKGDYFGDPLTSFAENGNPGCFIHKCLTINLDYRLTAALFGNISYFDGAKCCCQIFGSVSNNAGLLRELYSKIK